MDYEITLKRFREGVKDGSLSLRDIEEKTGIPYTTLIEMRRPDWQNKTFTRLEKLKDVIGEGEPSEAA